MEKLSNPEIRKLKARAQLMEATFKVGKAGLSAGFIKSISDAFAHHDLIKIRFDEFKEEKDELSAQLAQKTESQLIMRVGHVAVLYKKLAKPAGQKIDRNDSIDPEEA